MEKNWNFVRNLIASNFNSSGFIKKSVKPEDVIYLESLDEKRKIIKKEIDFNYFKNLIEKRKNGQA
jgi:hypothetical protein